jgi:hypothetical protein
VKARPWNGSQNRTLAEQAIWKKAKAAPLFFISDGTEKLKSQLPA